MNINSPIQNKIDNRLKIYIPFPKPLFFLFKNRLLNTSELLFYVYLASIAQFDNRNPLYQIVDFTLTEISKNMNMSYESVNNWANKLIRIGLIKKIDRGYIEIIHYEEFFKQPSKTFAGKIDLEKKILNFVNTKLQNTTISSYSNDVKDNINDRLNISSYKENISSISVKENTAKTEGTFVKSEEEYQSIYEMNNKEGLTPEVMKEIDLSLQESTFIKKDI